MTTMVIPKDPTSSTRFHDGGVLHSYSKPPSWKWV